LSYDSFLALRSKAIVQAFLATNASQRDLQRNHAKYMAFVACLMTAFLYFAQAIMRTFLAMNALQQELKRA
jgi:hypothetical protein